MDYKEVKASTVSEAITQACIELGLTSDRLDIEVISEGSKGFLGLGNKPAVIKVREKAAEEEKKEEQTAEKKPEEPETAEAGERKHSGKRHKRNSEPVNEEITAAASVPAKKERRPVVEKTPEEVDAMVARAEGFLQQVFSSMGLNVSIKSEYTQGEGNLDMEFSGDDMGVLIGKRGQTLDSLQYLTSLVVNKGQSGYVRVKLDTEDYRRRRRETLENFAGNIANKVKKTRKPVVLEPMNPYERRVIHSALQPNKFVETYSEGNEPYRHVVVAPRK